MLIRVLCVADAGERFLIIHHVRNVHFHFFYVTMNDAFLTQETESINITDPKKCAVSQLFLTNVFAVVCLQKCCATSHFFILLLRSQIVYFFKIV